MELDSYGRTESNGKFLILLTHGTAAEGEEPDSICTEMGKQGSDIKMISVGIGNKESGAAFTQMLKLCASDPKDQHFYKEPSFDKKAMRQTASKITKIYTGNVCQTTRNCTCDPCIFGDICQHEENKCDSNPCQQGGTCQKVDPCTYKCNCFRGTNGTNCEVDIDECASNPCMNGGTCLEPKPGVFGNPPFDFWECECALGYTGVRCEIDIDECASNPCNYGGTCVQITPPAEPLFRCHCERGYQSNHTESWCDHDIDECKSNPCGYYGDCWESGRFDKLQRDNGTRLEACDDRGRCREYPIEPAKFFCVCHDCYDFQYDCRIPIMECASSPCQNKGICIEGDCEYSCDCESTGFTGSHCETEIDDCLSNPCQNEGTCNDFVNYFTCDCPEFYFGSLCETFIRECSGCRHESVCVFAEDNPDGLAAKRGWE